MTSTWCRFVLRFCLCHIHCLNLDIIAFGENISFDINDNLQCIFSIRKKNQTKPKPKIILISPRLAGERLKRYNSKTHSFCFHMRQKYLSVEECCTSGQLLFFKSLYNLHRLSFSSGIFAELHDLDKRYLDLPGQLRVITALPCRLVKRKDFPTLWCTLLFYHTNETWPWLRSDEKYFLYRCSIHKWGLTLCSKMRED